CFKLAQRFFEDFLSKKTEPYHSGLASRIGIRLARVFLSSIRSADRGARVVEAISPGLAYRKRPCPWYSGPNMNRPWLKWTCVHRHLPRGEPGHRDRRVANGDSRQP